MNPGTNGLCIAARSCGYWVSRRTFDWIKPNVMAQARVLYPMRRADANRMEACLILMGQTYRWKLISSRPDRELFSFILPLG